MWCILLYLHAIFVATPTGEVSEVEIFLRFDGVPEPALSSVFARTCSQWSVFFRVHPLSVRGLTFTCMRGSVIFSNMLDFAVYVWTTCVACPLAAFGGSISPCLYSVTQYEVRDPRQTHYQSLDRHQCWSLASRNSLHNPRLVFRARNSQTLQAHILN